MARQLEAVYEDGLLRPLEPLALEEKQHVMLTITEVSLPASVSSRAVRWKAEQKWLRLNSETYAGQWVALHGDHLLSHGFDAFAVRDEARAKGVQVPLMVHLPDEPNLPSAGLLLCP